MDSEKEKIILIEHIKDLKAQIENLKENNQKYRQRSAEYELMRMELSKSFQTIDQEKQKVEDQKKIITNKDSEIKSLRNQIEELINYSLKNDQNKSFLEKPKTPNTIQEPNQVSTSTNQNQLKDKIQNNIIEKKKSLLIDNVINLPKQLQESSEQQNDPSIQAQNQSSPYKILKQEVYLIAQKQNTNGQVEESQVLLDSKSPDFPKPIHNISDVSQPNQIAPAQVQTMVSSSSNDKLHQLFISKSPQNKIMQQPMVRYGSTYSLNNYPQMNHQPRYTRYGNSANYQSINSPSPSLNNISLTNPYIQNPFNQSSRPPAY